MMKLKVPGYLLMVFFVLTCIAAGAQNAKHKANTGGKNYPAAFTVDKNDFDGLFLYKNNEPVSSKANKFLNGSVLLLNTKNGDMKFLKLKLGYFKNAYMLVQVNGSYSTQVFIMSDDKSVFYKGRFEKGNLLMSKCLEDEIVSE